MSIDPRLQERRKEVAEDRARRKVSRLLKVWAVLVVVGLVAWVLLSPWLDVDRVDTAGVLASEAHEVLADSGVILGRPLILIRAEEVEASLEDDPYVAEADVAVDWPDRVVVRVEERHPVAWVESAGGLGPPRRRWCGAALTGTARRLQGLDPAPVCWPIPTLPRPRRCSGHSNSCLGLPEELQVATTVRMRPTGELWAEVPDFDVRLGRPTEMEAKALSLVALLEEKPPRGSLLTLIAPAHPAVTPPQSREESQGSEP